jgi:prenyl protein peptidase
MVSFIHHSLGLPAPLSLGIPPSHSHILSLLFTSTYVGSIYVSQILFPSGKVRSFGRDSPGIPPVAAGDFDGQVPRRLEGPEVGSRDHPDTIKRRMKAVGTATVLSLGGVYWVIKQTGGYSWRGAVSPLGTIFNAIRNTSSVMNSRLMGQVGPTLRLLGMPLSPGDVLQTGWLAYVLAPTLLFGPLVAEYLDGDLWFQRPSSGGIVRRIKAAGLVGLRNYVVVSVAPRTGPLVPHMTIPAACC